jgi:bacterioferritin-associated ferredoxin
MVSRKTMVCLCEDITLEDVLGALHEGYDHFEDLKRYLGVATGPCQGKACVATCMKMVSEHRSIPLGDVDVMTFRPPVRPIPLAALAAPDASDVGADMVLEDHELGDPDVPRPPAHMLVETLGDDAEELPGTPRGKKATEHSS